MPAIVYSTLIDDFSTISLLTFFENHTHIQSQRNLPNFYFIFTKSFETDRVVPKMMIGDNDLSTSFKFIQKQQKIPKKSFPKELTEIDLEKQDRLFKV